MSGRLRRANMKAVIPAAVLGTRLLPLTKEQPKEILPVIYRPAIHSVFEEAVRAVTTNILNIMGREKRAVEDFFDGSLRWNHSLEKHKNSALRDLEELTSKAHFLFIRQREPRGLGDEEGAVIDLREVWSP